MATEVPGAEALGDAVREATARKGWRQSELDPRSKKAMLALDGEHTDRSRLGLSNRTWQDLWRGKKRIEMESYSYAVIDRTFKWTKGTAWAIHHGQEPPSVGHDEAVKLREDVDQLHTEVAGLWSAVRGLTSELHGWEALDDEVQGLKLMLPALLKELGRRSGT